jgi:sodium/proline symporter
MGIKDVSKMSKSKYVGMSWMTISLAAATLVGMVAIAYFPQGIPNSELIFIEMVSDNFAPFLVGFILCAVLAATISVMDSQILVLASSLTEDFYKKIIHKDASSKELLFVSRMGVLLMSGIAFAIAFFQIDTIYSLVLYAWSGLGASFGPLLIFALYSKKANKYGAWAGILAGGIIAGVWPYFNSLWKFDVPSLIPGFSMSCLAIWLGSKIETQPKGQSVKT